MPEVTTLIRGRGVSYSGLIDVQGFYKMLDGWFLEHIYDKQELKNYEEVFEDGKQITLEIMPYKKMSDYAKIEIYMFIVFSHLQDTVVERDGKKKKMYKGDVSIEVDCYLTTDYENTYETKPLYYFMRTMLDKFVYKRYTSSFQKTAVADCNEIITNMKSFFNMQKVL